MIVLKSAVLSLLAALTLSACGSQSQQDVEASLKSATVTALPGLDETKIAISTSERNSAKWTWTATYEGKAYSCDADERMRLPSCVPQVSTGDA
ncbi:MAG TPA: hypothetical protein PLN33_07145 [Hyphomonadaceae bacterium]|nr:hypothetical protein [Hyphomonadaceae bacterium]HPN04278.1 hypothetical protein [Hyphomonadaceae bacterium]